MSYIDIIIFLFILGAAIRGAFKGVIIELASMFALILGVWGAIHFSGAVASFLTGRMNVNWGSINIISFIITFIIISIGIHLLAKLLDKLVDAVSLSPVNRILGLIVSVFKTAFFLSIFILIIDQYDRNGSIIPKDDRQNSNFYEPLKKVSIYTFPFLKGLYDDIKGNGSNES